MESIENIETVIEPKQDEEASDTTQKEAILMAKIENVYHEPFQMTQEMKVCRIKESVVCFSFRCRYFFCLFNNCVLNVTQLCPCLLTFFFFSDYVFHVIPFHLLLSLQPLYIQCDLFTSAPSFSNEILLNINMVTKYSKFIR